MNIKLRLYTPLGDLWRLLWMPTYSAASVVAGPTRDGTSVQS
jgi:hypothetical protein